jgi:hypothetical protein
MIKREQSERDVLVALGEYKCDTGMSLEDMSAIVNIKTERVIDCTKFNPGWAVGVVTGKITA